MPLLSSCAGLCLIAAATAPTPVLVPVDAAQAEPHALGEIVVLGRYIPEPNRESSEVAAFLTSALQFSLRLCFLFAQNYHPALKRLGPIRRAIGERTIFNLMGPLANPANVRRQLVGIARPAYVPIYAQALAELGVDRAMIVSGDEGLDELSLDGGNDMAEVKGNALVAMHRLHGSDLDLPSRPVSAIRGGDAAHNAAALRALLQGEQSAYRDAVLLNAAVALVVADAAADLREGMEEAAETIDRGLANALLNCWIAYS